jgi:hypothetical protein
MMGRFGNLLFQYACAKGYAERNNCTLHTDPWIGQRLFNIEDPPIEQDLPRIEESELRLGRTDIELFGYFQNQTAAEFYSRKKLREWFVLRDSINALVSPASKPCFHLRRGDYVGSGYPVVSVESYRRFITLELRLSFEDFEVISEEEPHKANQPDDIPWLQDFYMLMTAPILIRANSSFSWWSAALHKTPGNCCIYSPIIDGLVGGKEHDSVKFVEGNWPKLAELPCITDIHI